MPRPIALASVLLVACQEPPPGPTDTDPADTDAADTDAADTDSPDTGAACVEVALQPAPADWVFLVDTSASWERRVERWQGLEDALATFLAAHGDDVGLAATTFPRGDAGSCETEDYTAYDLAWPASADAIVERVDAASFGGGSTLGPALEGALATASAHRAANPGRSTSVVLLTDASPNDDEACDASAWDEVARIAGAGFDDGRGVQTNVLSVMGTAVSGDHFVALGGIVVEGGGFAAFVNGSRTDVAASAHRALLDFYDRAATCTLALPEGVTPERLTVAFPDAGYELTRVADASACAGDAFYLDDPDDPTTATMCSGEGGIGGICELVFVRARVDGAPTVTTACDRVSP